MNIDKYLSKSNVIKEKLPWYEGIQMRVERRRDVDKLQSLLLPPLPETPLLQAHYQMSTNMQVEEK